MNYVGRVICNAQFDIKVANNGHRNVRKYKYIDENSRFKRLFDINTLKKTIFLIKNKIEGKAICFF
jgi:hypothetical protein